MTHRPDQEVAQLGNNIIKVEKPEPYFNNGETWNFNGQGLGKKFIDLYQQEPESQGNASIKLDVESSYTHDDKRDKASSLITDAVKLTANTMSFESSLIKSNPYVDLNISPDTAQGESQFNDVVFLMKGDSVTDLSNDGRSITTSGDPSSSNAQTLYAPNNLLFDGNGDRLDIAHEAGKIDFTTDSWTLDMKLYHVSTSGNVAILTKTNGTGSTNREIMVGFISGQFRVRVYTTGGVNNEMIAPSTTTGWREYRIVKRGDLVELYEDGVRTASMTLASSTVQGIASAMQIGEETAGNLGSDYSGHIDSIRLTQSARGEENTSYTPAEFPEQNIGGSVDSITVDGTELLDSPVNFIAGVDGQTDYDGVDDIITTTDTFHRIAGAQVWCCEVNIPANQPDAYTNFMSNEGTGQSHGAILYYQEGADAFRFEGRGGTGFCQVTASSNGLTGKWIKLVAVWDGANTMELHAYNGTTWVSNIDNTSSFNLSSSIFQIGGNVFAGNAPAKIDGLVRNMQFFSGIPNDPQDWDANDLNSLGGTTVNLMNSPNGSGLDAGLGFIAQGSPNVTNETQESGVAELASAINTGSQSANYSANTSETGLTGTVRIYDNQDFEAGNGDAVIVTETGLTIADGVMANGNDGSVTVTADSDVNAIQVGTVIETGDANTYTVSNISGDLATITTNETIVSSAPVVSIRNTEFYVEKQAGAYEPDQSEATHFNDGNYNTDGSTPYAITGTNDGGSFPPWRAFDGNGSSYWENPSVTECDLTITLDQPRAFNKISVRPHPNAGLEYNRIEVIGINSGQETPIADLTGLSPTNGSYNDHSFSNATEYEAYKLVLHDDTTNLYIGEIRLFESVWNPSLGDGDYGVRASDTLALEKDPNVVLLIDSRDQSNASTDFSDDSISNKTISSFGNVQHSTAKARFDTSSINFDGSGDYLEVAYSSDWDFTGANEGTIQFFINFNSVSGTQRIMGVGTSGNWLVYLSSGNIEMGRWGTGSVATSGVTYAINTWYHVAIVKETVDTVIYINGVERARTSIDYWSNNTSALQIGSTTGESSNYLNASIDGLMISQGASYTEDFPNPTNSLYSLLFSQAPSQIISVIAPNGSTSVINKGMGADTQELSMLESDASTQSYSTTIGKAYIAICDKFDSLGKPLLAKVLDRGSSTWKNILAYKAVDRDNNGADDAWYFWNGGGWVQAEKQGDNGARAFAQALQADVFNRNDELYYTNGDGALITESELNTLPNKPYGDKLAVYMGIVGDISIWNILGKFASFETGRLIDTKDMDKVAPNGQTGVSYTNNGASLNYRPVAYIFG